MRRPRAGRQISCRRPLNSFAARWNERALTIGQKRDRRCLATSISLPSPLGVRVTKKEGGCGTQICQLVPPRLLRQTPSARLGVDGTEGLLRHRLNVLRKRDVLHFPRVRLSRRHQPAEEFGELPPAFGIALVAPQHHPRITADRVTV